MSQNQGDDKLVITVPEDHESFAVALGEAAKGDNSEGAILISKISLDEIPVTGDSSVTNSSSSESSEELQKRLKLQALEILKKLKEYKEPPEADPVVDQPALQPYRDKRRKIYELASKTQLAEEDISEARSNLEELPSVLETAKIAINKRLSEVKKAILEDSCMTEMLPGLSEFAPEAHQRVLNARQAVENKVGLMTAVAMNEARELLRAVQTSLNDARVALLQAKAQWIIQEAKKCLDPEGADPILDKDSLKDVREARRIIHESLSKPTLTTQDVVEAQKQLENLPGLITTAKGNIEKRLIGARDTILNDPCMGQTVEGGEEFKAMTRVEDARQKVREAAQKLTSQSMAEAQELLRNVRTALNDAAVVVQSGLQGKAQEILTTDQRMTRPQDVDATSEDWQPVVNARGEVLKTFAKKPLTLADFATVQTVLLPAVDEAFRTSAILVRNRLILQAKSLATDACMTDTIADAETTEMSSVETARGKVTEAIAKLEKQESVKSQDVAAIELLLQQVRNAIESAKKLVQERLKKVAETVLKDVVDEGLLGKNPEGVLPKLEKALNTKRTEAKKLLETMPLTSAIIKQGEEARDALKLLIEKAKEEILALGGKEEIEKLQNAVGGQAQLEKLQDAFGITDPKKLMSLAVDFGGFETLKKLTTYKSNFTQLKSLSDNLGGPKCMSTLLVDGCAGDINKLDSIQKAFNGNFTKLEGLLKTGGLGKHPQALASLVKTGCKGSPDDFKKLCDSFGSPSDLENLSGLLEKGGLGAKPECFGQLVATGCSDPNDLKTFAKEFKNQLPQLQMLLGVKTSGEVDPEAEGGLGDNPEVFAHLFATGCSKDPEKFKTFLSTFDSTGVKNLNKLVKEGGFAKHQIEEPLGSGTKVDVVNPAALGKFLAVGCVGNPADLKTLCETLSSSPEGLKGLKNLMQLGGLGAKPDCLSQMFATGVKDDSGVGATATKFDEMLKTLDNPALLSKMQGLLGVKPNGLSDSTLAGGLGDNGEVFGNLIATGCEKDPTKLKSLLESFDASGLEGLNKLVKDGGFASHKLDTDGSLVRKQVQYPPGTNVNAVDPKCLGKLLETGCDKDPAKLQDLCKALTNQQRKRLQGCMETGRLGEDPDVIGHLYKIGCDKTPTDMQAFCNAFNTPAKQKKLQNLMKKGGFNGKPNQKKPATLGKVLKDAFKDGTTPHPEKLLDLHDAFPGDANLAKMERMFNAYNMPPVPGVKKDDPGKKLKRVMKALRIQNPNDFVKLRTIYYGNLDNVVSGYDFKPNGSSYNYNAGPPVIDELLDSLLANSATLDLSPVAKHTNPSPPPSLTEYDGDVRDYHFLNRHGRPFQDIDHHLTSPHPVSFWPEGFDGPAIMNQFNTALAFTTSEATLYKTNGGVFNKAAYVKTPGTTTTPAVYYGAGDPIDGTLMQLAGETYLQLLITQDGRELVIGIKRSGTSVFYPQFYPKSGPDIVKFDYDTIRLYMKPALGK